MAAQDRKGPKKNPDTGSPGQSVPDLAKLIQVVFNMKAEMGCMRKAMINAGMSFEKSPKVQKPREQVVNGKQENKFAGTGSEQPRRTSQVKLPNDLLCRSMIGLSSLIPMTTPNPNMEEW